MQTLKQTSEYTIMKRRDGRHAILDKNSKFVRGDEKTKILLQEGLIKLTAPKKQDAPAEAPAAG